MIVRRRLVPRALVAAVAALGLLAVSAPAMAGIAAGRHRRGGRARIPMRPPPAGSARRSRRRSDYGNPGAGFVKIAVTRLPAQDQANRIGALFINYGGPGGTAVDTTQAIGADPVRRGQRSLRPRRLRSARRRPELAVDRLQGRTRRPRASTRSRSRRPRTSTSTRCSPRTRPTSSAASASTRSILPYVSTANVARDMDGIRAAMGDKKLNYFGFSYGTFLGATYASLFPDNYRAMVLDGPVDANSYINTPSGRPARAVGRLRARDSAASSRPARSTRRSASSAAPIRRRPSTRSSTRPTCCAIPVPDGRRRAGQRRRHPRRDRARDVRQAVLAAARPGAVRGRGTATAPASATWPTAFWGNNEDGTFDPGADRYFTIGAIEQKYPTDVQTFLDAGDNAWGMFNYTYWNTGYPRSTTRSGRSTRRTPSAARSRPPSRRRRCSRSRRRTTRPRRTAAPSGSRRSSATCAS